MWLHNRLLVLLPEQRHQHICCCHKIKFSEIEYITPSGEKVVFQLKQQEITENYALCAIEKYSGDDPDVTSGMLIYTKVEKISKGFVVDGGKGIGRVTQKD